MMEKKISNNDGLTSRYIVQPNQNIFDVAVDVHGSIDGVSDLLIQNPHITIDTELKSGDELTFVSGVTIDEINVSDLERLNVTPVNGDRGVYINRDKVSDANIMDMEITTGTMSFAMTIHHKKNIYIDWGDHRMMDMYYPEDGRSDIHKIFDSSDEDINRNIRVYFDKDDELDIHVHSSDNFRSYIYEEILVDEYSNQSQLIDVGFTQLMSGVRYISLPNVSAIDLSPFIHNESWITLDISSKYLTEKTLDDFFINMVNNYPIDRVAGTIYLHNSPSGEYREPIKTSGRGAYSSAYGKSYRKPQPEDIPEGGFKYIINGGMEAVWLLVNDPAWNNEYYKWKVVIDGVIYEKNIKK